MGEPRLPRACCGPRIPSWNTGRDQGKGLNKGSSFHTGKALSIPWPGSWPFDPCGVHFAVCPQDSALYGIPDHSPPPHTHTRTPALWLVVSAADWRTNRRCGLGEGTLGVCFPGHLEPFLPGGSCSSVLTQSHALTACSLCSPSDPCPCTLCLSKAQESSRAGIRTSVTGEECHRPPPCEDSLQEATWTRDQSRGFEVLTRTKEGG